ncbi:hypothetical protein [Actinomadura sp. HBU206391]|uniref:hypothetical protein n=1 Tax=Actinomadura sp. HBU206391 TaxID=2731692 RepID=UPI001650B7D0|nr:hypothetical protein [Actinomadura sp. HBU206391]MBC6457170.1 hypothetical protein [Actinomadura sp. HBU206391]
MYMWIWRHLPGTPATRAATAAALALVLAAVLWYVVFPWLEPKVQFDRGVIDHHTSGPSTPRP